jgi:DNA polymerase III sliding clamp (beta) subunit (PCNA family)
MLAELKFVQGAIAKKDFLPALTHFRIEKGTVRGYNGTLALSSPIPLDLECTPKADPLLKAIANCTEVMSLSMTANGRLAVRSGSFKAFVDCVQGETPHVEPEGEDLALDGPLLLAALQALQPFVSDDASRPWSNGILLRGESAYATNNVVLVEYWLGKQLPTINIPRSAVKEIVRIGEPPIRAQANDRCITFHYTGGRWIRTQLLVTDWPDLKKVLDVTSSAVPIDPKLFVGLETIKPFVDKIGRVLFANGVMTTHENEDEGASFECDTVLPEGIYSLEMLMLLEGVATASDWSLYPKPAMFFGNRLRGAVIGMRR